MALGAVAAMLVGPAAPLGILVAVLLENAALLAIRVAVVAAVIGPAVVLRCAG